MSGRTEILKSPVLHAVVVLLAAVLPYLQTLHFPFILDDTVTIGENPVIQDLGRFLGGEGLRYRFLRFIGNLSLALNYHFGGLDTFGYHLVNTAVHGLTALLVYLLVRVTFRTPRLRASALAGQGGPLALATALLFAVHPVQTQAVTYIVQRFASLTALFYLLALVLYAEGRLRLPGEELAAGRDLADPPPAAPRLGGLFFAGAALAGVAAMLTKEIAFTLPLAVLLYEVSFFPPSRRRRLLLTVAGGAAVALPLLLLATAERPVGELLAQIDEGLRENKAISRWSYLLTQFRVLLTYLRLLFWPVRQNLDYEYPLFDSFTAPPVFLSFLALLALLALACWLYRRTGSTVAAALPAAANSGVAENEADPAVSESRAVVSPPAPVASAGDPALRLIGFGILWFFLTLAVESSLIPIADVLVEHRLYLPSAGIALAGTVSVALFGRRLSPRFLLAALAAIVLILGVATVRRNAVWGDPVTLWSDVVAKAPLNERGWCNLGNAYLERGETDAGIEKLFIAAQVNPDYGKTYLNLGVALGTLGRYEEAAQMLETALEKNPKLWLAHANLGTIYMRMGQLDTAIEHLEAGLRLNARDTVSRSQLDHLRQFRQQMSARP